MNGCWREEIEKRIADHEIVLSDLESRQVGESFRPLLSKNVDNPRAAELDIYEIFFFLIYGVKVPISENYANSLRT